MSIRYSSFLLHYFPVYACITTCHSYGCSCLSLLLSCEIPSGRSYHYSLFLPILTPGMQNLLSIGFFFQYGQVLKRERNKVPQGMVLCVIGSKKKKDTVIICILKNLAWKNKTTGCLQTVGQSFYRSRVTFTRLYSHPFPTLLHLL